LTIGFAVVFAEMVDYLAAAFNAFADVACDFVWIQIDRKPLRAGRGRLAADFVPVEVPAESDKSDSSGSEQSEQIPHGQSPQTADDSLGKRGAIICGAILSERVSRPVESPFPAKPS
jgi:hypothetical protein